MVFTPHKLKLYNLPQKVEGGIKIHGLKDDEQKDVVVLFHHLDGMYSYCTIQDPEAPKDTTGRVVHLSASTPLIEMEGGEYKIDEEAENDIEQQTGAKINFTVSHVAEEKEQK